jgi:hypothetical protein
MDIRESGLEGVECIRLIHSREPWWAILKLNTVMNFRSPYKADKFLTNWAAVSF